MASDYRGTCLYAETGDCAYENSIVRGRCVRELSRAYEIEREQGGANRVAGPKQYSGKVAHVVCHELALDRQKSGLTAGQESLL